MQQHKWQLVSAKARSIARYSRCFDVANANDITLYAKFIPTPYAIEYVIGKGGVLAEGAVTSYTVEDENGTPTSITFKNADKFNFA